MYKIINADMPVGTFCSSFEVYDIDADTYLFFDFCDDLLDDMMQRAGVKCIQDLLGKHIQGIPSYVKLRNRIQAKEIAIKEHGYVYAWLLNDKEA